MPTLVYYKGGRPSAYVFGVQDAPITIGRGMDCKIIIDQADVSRVHAEVFTDDHGVSWRVRDLDSANGTLINDARIQDEVLGDQDVMVCGTVALEFRRGPASERFGVTREGSSPHRTRYTPSQLPRVGQKGFEVRESGELPQIRAEEDTEPDPSALLQRIHVLEARTRRLEQENLRLRETIAEVGGQTDGPITARNVAHDDEPTSEKWRFLESAGNFPASIATAMGDTVMGDRRDQDRKKNVMLDRLSDMLKPEHRRHGGSSDEEE